MPRPCHYAAQYAGIIGRGQPSVEVSRPVLWNPWSSARPRCDEVTETDDEASDTDDAHVQEPKKKQRAVETDVFGLE